jgi:hypothetical protein
MFSQRKPLMRYGNLTAFTTALLVCGVVGALPVQAQVTLFTDSTSFTNATSGLTTIDFNDQVTPPNTFAFYPNATVALSGVTFTGNSLLFAVNPAFSSGYGLGDGTVLSWQGANSEVLTVALPTGTTSVGFNFGAFASTAFTFTLSTGNVFVLTGGTSATTPPTFAGFVSAAPLTSLTISAVDGAPQIDRFSFGTAAVPEPGSIALLVGMGLSSAGFLARRRKQARKAA